jgi:fructose-bisphosphate aldolase class II
MVDMSHYEKEENLQLTKELTEYCHARGIITEAEPGRINGGEDGVAVSLYFPRAMYGINLPE